MAAINKADLEILEKQYGLEPDGLSYQHRCSRITAYQRGDGEIWEPPVKAPTPGTSAFKDHPMFGKRILITPLMSIDKDRALAYTEPLGPEMIVQDYNAGESIIGAPEDVQRMVGDYKVIHIDRSRQVMAKTTFPKIGTEISWKLGVELCPIVRGNDGKTGYIWSFPTSVVQCGDSMIQLYGLKTLIRQVYPELEPKFSGKPMMDYVDGVTLVASIPQTHALLKQHRRQEMLAQRAGLGDDYGLI